MKKNKTEIINQVKEIILKHAKPVRIYLYGSQVTGDASDGSDIDIAYEDPDNKNNYLIEEGVRQINTLINQDLNRNTFSVPEYAKEEMFRTYMTVAQPYSLLLRIPEYIFNPL